MESLACGTPVVAFNIGGNSDMIDHQQNGYLAEDKNAEDLTNGIQWCLNKNADGKLGRKAREKVMETFAISIVAEQYNNLYRTL